ncbi:ferredoxin reductase family protein [Plantactinospora sp. B5E13]|uniref:ferredoxin reductase family protein n=1 Tax=Plantactinospora sp. B5E13 TaxID=3153758 RepID=UPI00325CC04A
MTRRRDVETAEPLTEWVTGLIPRVSDDDPYDRPPSRGRDRDAYPDYEPYPTRGVDTYAEPDPDPYPTRERPRRGGTDRSYPSGDRDREPRSYAETAPAWRPGPSGGAEAARHRETAEVEVYDRGGRLFFHIVFWAALATTVELWWLNTPTGSITTTADVLVAGGRLTGLVGGYLLLAQVLLMSRVRWLERWIGAHSLLIWHRELGAFLLLAILAHAALIAVGYSKLTNEPLVDGTWTLLSTYEDMLSAVGATAIIVGIALLAIRGIRRRMNYELWYYLHLSTYLVLLFSYGHQFATGQEFVKPGFGRYFWAGLYVFVIVSVLWGRIISPLRFNLRHRLQVEDVVPEGTDMVSIYISGQRLDELDARAGQYFRWRFLTKGCWWQAHPFSLSAAPNEQWLRLTVKIVGDHTESLQYLEPGTKIFAEGPSGVFTANRAIRPRALLIAGGSGIAPIRALLEDLPERAVVIYRSRTEEELLFRDELDWLARSREAQVWYVIGSREDPAPRHLFTAKGMRELVPDVRRRDIYLCGPPGLVDVSLRTLRKLRVPRRQIHLDPFEF